MVAIRNTGGIGEQFIDKFLDHKESVRIIGANNPKEAVKLILERITA
jgi:hypothetical protein